jgi:hypothetical protein
MVVKHLPQKIRTKDKSKLQKKLQIRDKNKPQKIREVNHREDKILWHKFFKLPLRQCKLRIVKLQWQYAKLSCN